MNKYKFGKTIIMALGGSIIYPNTIDAKFLKDFKKFIREFTKKKYQFVIVVGGGQLARVFQTSAAKVAPITNDDKDWLGIHSTRLNAHLLRTIFRDIADPVVFDSRGKIKKIKYPITMASGWRPGWSTDYIAAAIAADFKIPEFIVAGKPEFVYDKNPSIHKNAVPQKLITWKDYRKIIPRKWTPGMHAPVDPVAAKLANEKKLKAIIINGKDLKNFSRLLKGGDFYGSIIS